MGDRGTRPEHEDGQRGCRDLDAAGLVTQFDRVVRALDADLLGVEEGRICWTLGDRARSVTTGSCMSSSSRAMGSASDDWRLRVIAVPGEVKCPPSRRQADCPGYAGANESRPKPYAFAGPMPQLRARRARSASATSMTPSNTCASCVRSLPPA